MRKLVPAGIFLLALLAALNFAHGRLYIRIHGPGIKKIPIGFPGFGSLDRTRDTLDAALSRVMKNDLDFSGYFNIVDPKAYLEKPLRMRDVNPANWRLIGADLLVLAGFRRSGTRLYVEARLVDISQTRQIWGASYRGYMSQWREMVHRLGDEMVERVSGVKGIFNTKIAFINQVKRRKDVWITDYDGFGLRKVTSDTAVDLTPRFSPDGRSMVFVSYRKKNPDIYLADISGRNTRVTVVSSKKGINSAPAWHPSGLSIVAGLSFQGNPEIYQVDLMGGASKRLTRNVAIDIPGDFSPDGKSLALVSNRAGSPQVYVMDMATRRTRRITFEGGYNTSPRWSPRGDLITFSSMGNGKFHVCVIRPDGSDFTQVTRVGSNEHPVFSPDGRHLAFASNRSGDWAIYGMLTNGTNVKRLTVLPGTQQMPDWSPRSAD